MLIGEWNGECRSSLVTNEQLLFGGARPYNWAASYACSRV